jgi:hypothetical protein
MLVSIKPTTSLHNIKGTKNYVYFLFVKLISANLVHMINDHFTTGLSTENQFNLNNKKYTNCPLYALNYIWSP